MLGVGMLAGWGYRPLVCMASAPSITLLIAEQTFAWVQQTFQAKGRRRVNTMPMP